ncbi:MAG: hypothetical protein ACKVT0_11040 [Planctomycetaceae bacterium]
MKSHSVNGLAFSVFVYGIFCSMTTDAWTSNIVRAQDAPASRTKAKPDGKKKKSDTIVRVELLTGRDGAGTATVEWGRAFEKLGYDLRIRRTELEDKLEIDEKQHGPLRQVTAVGRLDRNGAIVFEDRSFTLDQVTQLGEWLRDLETYGAQGSPKGKPLWGLNEEQFQEVFTILAEPIDIADAEGQPLVDVIDAFGLPEELPLQWTTASRELIDSTVKPPVVSRVPSGLSRGTVMAFLLNEHGLGLQPRRTPMGTVEVQISPLSPDDNFWPVGWPVQGKPYSVVPHMFKPLPVELEDVPIAEVFEAIEERAKISILIDRNDLATEGIKLPEINVTYPSKQTTWSVLLKAITNPHRLTREIRIDEAGTPFVWISVLRPGKAKTSP